MKKEKVCRLESWMARRNKIKALDLFLLVGNPVRSFHCYVADRQETKCKGLKVEPFKEIELRLRSDLLSLGIQFYNFIVS